MSRTRKKYTKSMVELYKRFRRPFKILLEVLPIGANEADYIHAFQDCFPYLWDELDKCFSSYKEMDKSRKEKGFKFRYNFPSPVEYIHKNARAYITRLPCRENLQSETDRQAAYEKLRSEGLLKLSKVKIKKEQVQKYIQNVEPSFFKDMESYYFKLKRQEPANVDDRMAVVLEASKYRSNETIKFLYKVNSSETNFNVRNTALRGLQKLGKQAFLRKNRKGKKHIGDDLSPKEVDTPGVLLERIAKSQVEQLKKVDLFIAHSYKNADKMLNLKVNLNMLGFSIYLDWINDKAALKRTLFGRDSIEILNKRIELSKFVLFVLTPESTALNGVYYDECKYADTIEKEVLVLQLENTDKYPDFLSKYKRIININKNYYVIDNENRILLGNYINNTVSHGE